MNILCEKIYKYIFVFCILSYLKRMRIMFRVWRFISRPFCKMSELTLKSSQLSIKGTQKALSKKRFKDSSTSSSISPQSSTKKRLLLNEDYQTSPLSDDDNTELTQVTTPLAIASSNKSNSNNNGDNNNNNSDSNNNNNKRSQSPPRTRPNTPTNNNNDDYEYLGISKDDSKAPLQYDPFADDQFDYPVERPYWIRKVVQEGFYDDDVINDVKLLPPLLQMSFYMWINSKLLSQDYHQFHKLGLHHGGVDIIPTLTPATNKLRNSESKAESKDKPNLTVRLINYYQQFGEYDEFIRLRTLYGQVSQVLKDVAIYRFNAFYRDIDLAGVNHNNRIERINIGLNRLPDHTRLIISGKEEAITVLLNLNNCLECVENGQFMTRGGFVFTISLIYLLSKI